MDHFDPGAGHGDALASSDEALVSHGAHVDENAMFEMDGGQHGFGNHGGATWDNFVDGGSNDHLAVASQGEWLSQTDEQDGGKMAGQASGHEDSHYFQEAPPPRLLMKIAIMCKRRLFPPMDKEACSEE